jgi:uncharacterized membrane protein YfcA
MTSEVPLWGGIVIAGLFLGLLGGGGGILLVPLLLFLGGATPAAAASESLTLLGIGAAVGAALYARRGQVDFPKGTLFALASFSSWLLAKKVVLPLFPAAGARDAIIFGLFLVVMMISGTLMILPKKKDALVPAAKPLRTLLGGILAGAIMGFTGAGGGFVIVPSLVKGLGIPMKRAVGTSLWVITATAAAGLLFSSREDLFPSTSRIAALVLGVIPGFLISHGFSSESLKRSFGIFTWFVALGSLILKLKAGLL